MKKLLNSRFFIFLMVLPFFEPQGISDMASYLGGIWFYIDLAFKVLKCGIFIVVTILTLYELQKPTPICLIIMLFHGIVLLSSLQNGNLTFSIVLSVITMLGACILTDYYIRSGNIYKYLAVVADVLGGAIILNFISILLYPNGMYVSSSGWRENYFLGYRNVHIYVYLLFFIVNVLIQYISFQKLNIGFYSMCLLIFVSTIMSHSSTTTIAISVLVIMIFLFRNATLPRWFNMITIYFASLLSSTLIIVFRIQDYFAFFIEGILKKNLTFTGRETIWNISLSYIAEKPLLGSGYTSFDWIHQRWIVTQVHNRFLDVVLMGGIFLLVVFTVIFILLNKKMVCIYGTPVYNILLFVWLAYAILFLMEAKRSDVCMYISFIITYHVGEIINCCSKNTMRKNIQYKHIRITLGRRHIL